MAIGIDKDEQFKKLCDFWLSGELEELGRYNEKFNIFTALKLDNAEIRHSNFLAWLMNPLENHEIGDYFLKTFLEIAIKDFIQDKRIEVKAQDILGAKFFDCEIRREYNNIDILIINPDNKFLCLIENKIWSCEHSRQLERYAKCVSNEFKGYKKLYLFLAPNPNYNEPLLERDGAYYIQMSYEQVIKAIEKTLKHRSKIMPDGVITFIKHYKKMVERNIMGKVDEEVVLFCRSLYRNHKEAIDLITANTDLTQELTDNIKEIFKDELQYISDGMFRLKKLDKLAKIKHGNSKYGNDLILLQLEKNANGFVFCINIVTAETGYENMRKNLVEFLEKKLGIIFNHNPQETWHYYNKPVISSDEYYNFKNYDEAKNYLKTKIDETGFIADLNDAINEYASCKV